MFACDPGSRQERLVRLASEVAQERERLLSSDFESAYIRRGRHSELDGARLAHKFLAGMMYTYTETVRVVSESAGLQQRAVRTRQGLHRLVSKFDYDEYNGEVVRRRGRKHRPASTFDALVVLARKEGADLPERYATRFNLPFAMVVDPLDGKPDVRDLANLLPLGPVHTLYVTDPGLFASERQRQVVYALALHCGIRVVEGDKRVTRAARDDDFDQLLMDGTQLFLGLRAHDRATVLEHTRSDAYRGKLIADLRASGASLARIAERLNEEAVPTPRGSGRWHKSAVQKLLRDGAEGGGMSTRRGNRAERRERALVNLRTRSGVTLTYHARARAAELRFHETEVLQCVVSPETTYGCGPAYPPGARIFQRGDCACVVHVPSSAVLTVLLRRRDQWKHGVDDRYTPHSSP